MVNEYPNDFGKPAVTEPNENIDDMTKEEYQVCTISKGRKGVDQTVIQSENVDVVKYMQQTRGVGRGSALVGNSVHDQRVERLWRDVFEDVLKNFYELFSLMEELGILDPLAEIDLWCLHFAFLHHINYRLDGVLHGLDIPCLQRKITHH